MRFFLVCLMALLALCVGSSVALRQTQYKKAAENPAVEFLEGFAEGFDADFGNVSACINDSTTVVDDMEKAFDKIKDGIDHLSGKDVREGLLYLADGLEELVRAIEACGVPSIANSILKIVDKIKNGPEGWLSLIVDDILKFWKDRKTIGHDIVEAYDAFKDKNYFKAGYYTGKVTGILLESKRR